MTIPPTELQHKVQQLDNDVQAIYELLSGIEGTQRRHSNRFKELSQQVSAVDTKVSSLDTKVDNLDTKFGALDTKLDEALRLLRGGDAEGRP